MLSFFRRKPKVPDAQPPADPASAPAAPPAEAPEAAEAAGVAAPATAHAEEAGEAGAAAAAPPAARAGWLERLRAGLTRTGTGIAQVFTGVRIDDTLYEELETALLLADTGVAASQYLLDDLKRRVKEAKATSPQAVRRLLMDALTDLLAPLQGQLTAAAQTPTVIMVAGVNGAGKTTSIGKLTAHLARLRLRVLLAAADTFRAAARDQLLAWADRNQVDIVSQEGGDPAAVCFDAVQAGRARRCDVVIADTAGRLPTQLHLMEELRKIHRTLGRAMPGAPHEVLLVVDGNTGQNVLSQVRQFDAALGLTGLVVTKLDGTAKGGVLAAVALWVRERTAAGGRGLPVYFIGVGEQLQDLQPFEARDFATALLGGDSGS